MLSQDENEEKFQTLCDFFESTSTFQIILIYNLNTSQNKIEMLLQNKVNTVWN